MRFNTDPQVFLGDTYQAEDYEQVTDIPDVWFDGTTHAFVLEERNDLHWPADVYLKALTSIAAGLFLLAELARARCRTL